MCLLINGELMEYGYFRRLFAYHLPCFVTFFAIFYKVNSKKEIEFVVLFLVIIALFDSIITVMQARGSALAWAIGTILTPLENIEGPASRVDAFLGYSIIPGIFGGVVRNGYFLASFFPLGLLYVDNIRNPFKFFLFVLCTIVIMYAIFITQQRAAFYLSLLSLSIFFCLRLVRKPGMFILIGILLLFFITSIEGIINGLNLGRLSETHDDAREAIRGDALTFIQDNWLVGAPMKFQSHSLSAHNLAIDGLIFSGIFGFIALMTFAIKSLIQCARCCIKYLKGQSSLIVLTIALSLLSCILYGFTHNTSVLTGEPVIFILLALFFKAKCLYE